MVQDTTEIKRKIIQTLQEKGPNIPARISSEIGQSMLFTSAFLSELLSEKKIKTSHLRVGSSPVYLIPGDEAKLEEFSDNLKSKEKEAFLLLKEKGFLKDSEQEPAIRVALREIKDFAIPINNSEGLKWKYLTAEKIQEETSKVTEEKISEAEEDVNIKEDSQQQNEEVPKKEKPKPVKKKVTKKKTSTKANEKFFNIVKEYLGSKDIEITGIEGFSKSDLFLKIKHNEEEKLLVAHNKKRISEDEFIKANKKAEELGLKYIIISKGELLKKTQNLIAAIKNLSEHQILE